MTYVINLINNDTGTPSITPVTNYVVNGFSILEKLDESLDVGVITLRGLSTATPYTMFDTIEILIGGTVIYSQRISGDNVTLISKNPLRYEHTLSLVEHTKILERFIISGKTFTQPTIAGSVRYYIYDVIDYLIKTNPLETNANLNTTRLFTIPSSGDLYDLLTTTVSPEFTFKDVTFREALNQVCGYIDGIPRLVRLFTGVLELSIDFVNELNTLISSESYFIDKKIQQETTLYATELESEALNLVNDAEISESVEIFPSDGGYISLRKDTFLQDGYDDNAYIPTNKNIYSIPKLICRCDITSSLVSVGTVYQDGFIDIDITPRLVEKKIYDTLVFDGSVASTQYKTTTIYYTYRSKQIQHGITYGLWGISDVITNVIEYTSFVQMLADGTIPSGTDISQISFTLNTHIDDLLFQVHYVPINKTMRLSIDRQDLSDVNKKSTLLSNQQNRIVNLENFSNNMQGKINRIGNSELQLEHRVATIDDLYDIGDYTSDIYIITEKETIFYKDYVYAKYGLSKNYNMISKFIGVNTEIRQWEMGENNTLDRNLMYKEYIEIGVAQTGTGSNSSQMIQTDGVITFLETFKASSSYEPVRGGIIEGSDFSDDILVSLSSNGGGNSLIFNWKFQENVSAGWTRETVSGQTAKNFIPYTDDDGISENFTLHMFDKLSAPASEASNLTRADLVPSTDLSYIDTTLFENATPFQMYKDSREIIGVTIQEQMISFDSDVLILGRYLALKNRLVTENPPTEIRLYTYTDGTTYGRTDTLTLKSGYDIESSYTTVPVISSTDFKITITDVRLLAGKDCWCLTDENDNLLLAVNQNAVKLDTITFDFLNKRSEINYNY